MPKFLLVPNPIGDRTPVLQLAADGSVTIYLQKDSPGPDKESNWLPAPEGDFRPAMRMYQPSPEILKGDYLLPPIHRDQLNVTRRVPRCTARPPARLSRPCVPAWADYCSASVFLIAAMPFLAADCPSRGYRVKGACGVACDRRRP